LGHIINRDGLAVDPKKVADILDWKASRDFRGIKSFIGMVGYYCHFIEGFSKIARPMIALLAKKVEFKWTPMCQDSFEALKKKLTTTHVLILPDDHKSILRCILHRIRMCDNARKESGGVLIPTAEDP
jgi:hypothetical protein